MTPIASDWCSIPLKEVLAHTIGGIWGELPGESEVDVHVVRVTELKKNGVLEPATAAKRSIKNSQFMSRQLQVGDIVLEKSGGGPTSPVGRVGFVKDADRPSVCSNFMQLLRADPERVLAKYLHLYLTYFQDIGGTASLQTATTNIRNLKMAEYLDLPIPIPHLDEQKRIVEILEEQLSRLDAATVSFEKLSEKIASHKRSLLNAGCSGALEGSEGFPNGALPSKWELMRLGDCLEKLKSGKFAERGWSPQCLSHPVSNSDSWGVLKTTAVQMGQYQPVHNKELPAHLDPKSGLEVNDGDFLVTTTGPRNRCGIVCLVRSTPRNLIFSGKILRFRANEQVVLSGWLMFLLMSPKYQEILNQLKVGSSDSSVSIGNNQILDLVIPVPPLVVQKSLVNIIDEVISSDNRLLEVLSAQLTRISNLSRSLLHAAFTGQLTKESTSV